MRMTLALTLTLLLSAGAQADPSQWKPLVGTFQVFTNGAPPPKAVGNLTITEDGHYTWNAARGDWKDSGETLEDGFPIVLLKAEGGKDWKVARGETGSVMLWDGDYRTYKAVR